MPHYNTLGKKLPDQTYFKFLSEWNFKGIYIGYGMAGSNILNI